MKLEELAKSAGVAPRTVRYYVQRGLLPAPQFRGRDTEYGEEHEVRLRAIRKLQEIHYPLDAIQSVFDGHSLEEVRRIAEGKVPQMGRAAVSVTAPIPATRRWSRFELAPGLELHLADDAGQDVVSLAQKLRREVERTEG